MSDPVMINGTPVGDGYPCFIVAEIGINHNGDLEIGEEADRRGRGRLRRGEVPETHGRRLCTRRRSSRKPRENPFGPTNGDLKRGSSSVGRSTRRSTLLPGERDRPGSRRAGTRRRSTSRGVRSAVLQDRLRLAHRRRSAAPPPPYGPADHPLDRDEHARAGRPRRRGARQQDLVVMHTNSTYPSEVEELNLRAINTLRERYGVPVGYSGHEVGLAPSLAAAALGACSIERHITLDRRCGAATRPRRSNPAGYGSPGEGHPGHRAGPGRRPETCSEPGRSRS